MTSFFNLTVAFFKQLQNEIFEGRQLQLTTLMIASPAS